MNKKNKKINKKINKKNNNNKYNADNEIIIGVTTKPKEKVRVEKKTTRTNVKKVQSQQTKERKKNNTKNKVTIKKKVTAGQVKENYIKKKNKKKIITSISFLFFIFLGSIIYYLTTPIFNVENIIIEGNDKNSVDIYISLSKIIIGETNIFAFTQNGIRNNIKENAYVEDVRLNRKLPNTVEINITERKVDYQVECANKFVYLDKQGYILEMNEQKKEVPIIKGLNIIEQEIKIGKRISNDDLLKMDVIIKIVNYCQYNNLEDRITSIDATNITNYILTFGDGEKIAYIGDATSLTEKMTAVSKVLSNEKGKNGEIFADEETLKRNRVYFREKN